MNAVIKTSSGIWIGPPQGQDLTDAVIAAIQFSRTAPRERVHVFTIVRMLPHWHSSYQNGTRILLAAKELKARTACTL
jgi:hypothetical protein